MRCSSSRCGVLERWWTCSPERAARLRPVMLLCFFTPTTKEREHDFVVIPTLCFALHCSDHFWVVFFLPLSFFFFPPSPPLEMSRRGLLSFFPIHPLLDSYIHHHYHGYHGVWGNGVEVNMVCGLICVTIWICNVYTAIATWGGSERGSMSASALASTIRSHRTIRLNIARMWFFWFF